MAIDQSSAGFQIGKSIIGKHDTPLPKPQGPNRDSGDKPKLSRIELEPAENDGWTVTHTLKDTPGAKNEGMDYDSRHKKHVFGDSKSAHAHVAGLMGCGGE